LRGFIEDFLAFSRSPARKHRDIEKSVEKRLDEVAKYFRGMKAKVEIYRDLKSEVLGLESRGYMLEATFKSVRSKLYLAIHIPLVLTYEDKVHRPGLVYTRLFKSYPGQQLGGILKSLSPVRHDEFMGEAIDIFLLHGDAPRVDKENKFLALLLALNPTLYGFRDNMILICHHGRGKIRVSRISILLPLIIVFYTHSKRSDIESMRM